MGVKYGFASIPETLFYARSLLPPGAIWSAFGIGRAEFPMLAQAWLLGGNVRVGLEDNIYLSKGVLAKSNADLVAKARAHSRRSRRVRRDGERSPRDVGPSLRLMPKALNIGAKAPSADKIDVALVEFGSVGRNEGDVTIEVHAAGINPSDAKAMLGIMPSAVFPRTPGRDFAGVVVEGPNELKGLEVWGSGGDIGISRNGSHADRLVLPAAAIRRKPGSSRCSRPAPSACRS